MRRATLYDRALVLLSGGFDSTAALHWAIQNHPNVRAISFDYGQPNRDAELYRAQTVAERLGVPWLRVAMAGTLPRLGLLATVTDHAGAGGINRAFVPGRNAVFLSVAGAHAALSWPSGNLDLVIGACPEDAAGFPDCRPSFLAKMGETLRSALNREVQIVAPFIDRTKAQVFAAFDKRAEAIEDLARSYSCYRGGEPCGACSACVARAASFAAAGVADLSAAPVMCGGDPAREARQ